MNKAISNLPYIIIFYWLLCLYFFKNNTYQGNYLFLDYIDYIPVCICVYSFFMCMIKEYNYYSPCKASLVYTIIAISLMAHYKLAFGAELYIRLYKTILFGGIIIAVLTYFFTSRDNG